jgi:hypothetical protein
MKPSMQPLQLARVLRARAMVSVALGVSMLTIACEADEAGERPSAVTSAPTVDGGVQVTNFFVSSDTNMTGNLGGLAGADARCQALADAAGLTGSWVAYLSAEGGPDSDGPIHARDRIGQGPWYNSRGVMLAADLDALHARSGDAELFLDENGDKVPGNWPDSPKPSEHDVLTGTNMEGRLEPGRTCADWTSDAADLAAMVGHSDGLGPGGDPTGMYGRWHSSHLSESCNNTAPRGGAGRIYCFGHP